MTTGNDNSEYPPKGDTVTRSCIGAKLHNEPTFITKDSGKRKIYASGLHRDDGEKPLYTEVYYPLVKRHAELMMRGAVKYDRGNWKKAYTEEDLQRFKDSLLRHTYQYLNGDKDEDHLAACLFNLYGIAMIEDKLNMAPPTCNGG